MAEWLRIEVLSGATFSAGKGVSGDVNVDVEQEPCGLPIIHGRTLKGLLVEERDTILSVLNGNHWGEAAKRLFGKGKESDAVSGILWIGDARLPEKVRTVVMKAVNRKENQLQPSQLLSSLTEVRHQTRIDRETGTPAETSLRTVRVVLPGVKFYAPLRWIEEPTQNDRVFLSMCAMLVKRGGLARNRGRGKLVIQYIENNNKEFDKTSILNLV